MKLRKIMAGIVATAVTASMVVCALPASAATNTLAKGEAIIERLHEAVPECESSITDLADAEALRAAVADCDILVNATKVGMKPLDDQTLIDHSMFRSDLVVADTVYNS